MSTKTGVSSLIASAKRPNPASINHNRIIISMKNIIMKYITIAAQLNPMNLGIINHPIQNPQFPIRNLLCNTIHLHIPWLNLPQTVSITNPRSNEKEKKKKKNIHKSSPLPLYSTLPSPPQA